MTDTPEPTPPAPAKARCWLLIQSDNPSSPVLPPREHVRVDIGERDPLKVTLTCMEAIMGMKKQRSDAGKKRQSTAE